MKNQQSTFWVGGVVVISLTFGLVSPAQDTESGRDLPGYYEFFLKTGKSSRLRSEVKRDEDIQTGKVKPIAVNEPVLELKLPDGFDAVHSTRAYVGQKNIVLITGRAWW